MILQTTLVLLFNPQGQILLAMKKRWFGKGKRNGPGGKLEEGETFPQAAIRETKEEVWATLQEEGLTYTGFLQFRFLDTWEAIDCTVFTSNYEGEVEESEEMMPKWFSLKEIPFDEMWSDDKIWLPKLLAWEKDFVYEFSFTSAADPHPKRKKLQ
jgi:8-oxo-dGTP pyrophosphatase MutT (NUDIX family)